MTLKDRQTEFVELFNSIDEWTDKFQYLIELGNELPDIPEHLKTMDTLISTCQARTYFRVILIDGKVHIDGWSNASVVAGLISMLKNIFEGSTPFVIMANTIDFHIQTGLIDNMTELRKATLQEMIRRIISL